MAEQNAPKILAGMKDDMTVMTTTVEVAAAEKEFTESPLISPKSLEKEGALVEESSDKISVTTDTVSCCLSCAFFCL